MNTRIKPLLIGFASFVSILLFLLGISSYLMLNSANNALDHEVSDAITLRDLMGDAKFHVTEIQQFVTDSAATGEKDGLDDAAKNLQDLKAVLARVTKIDTRYSSDANAIAAAAEIQLATGGKMVAGYAQGREAGNAIMKEKGGFDEQSDAAKEQLNKLFNQVQKDRDAAFASIDSILESSLKIMLLLGVIILTVNIAGAFLLYKRVFQILGGEPVLATQLAGHLAAGDLSQPINVANDLQHSLLGRLASMSQRWREIARKLHGEVSSLSQASNSLSASANQLASNSSEQTAEASAIAANVEQLSASIEHIADQADQANIRVQESGRTASISADKLDQVISGINDVAIIVGESATLIQILDGKTREIESIVTVIREIADQTNLLALNAAIEAARAGDMGRGFAVVADEVRKLAERTSSSTTTIATMISDVHHATIQIVETIHKGVEKVNGSVVLTNEASSSMAEICTISADASQLVEKITYALAEQRSNSQNIAVRVEKISRVIETNAGVARTVATSSTEMQRVTETVRAEVSFFKLT